MSASTTARVPQPPTGTVTFFFSDIEGSTKLVDALGPRYPEVLGQHRAAMRRSFAEHGGTERGTEGDSFFVVFPDAGAAVAAAVDATRNLAAIDWPAGHPVTVRIGLHTGEGRLVDGDYVGIDVHRAARIAAAGHGGQVLISESTRILAERALPADISWRDLGEHRLKDLAASEHLYQVVIEGQRTDFPPLRSLDRTVANLPALLSTIVGRDADVEAVRKLLDEAHLVTVTGPGGTGKTRLVQEVAGVVARTENVDVAFVPLEALTDADLIPVEAIRALRLDTVAARDPIDRLAEYLATRRTLLVLDNLEQLPAAGSVVRRLLDRVSTLSVLVSSQAALHLAGEHEYALGTLPLPQAFVGGPRDVAAVGENPAVRLFTERARAVRAEFVLDDSNVDAVVAICVRLDGLPLAIELAAAQAKLLSPAAILERIAGRLDSLASRRGDLPARQRTLRATVAWSYELLDEPARCLFRRMSVFAGGARLPEIEAVAAIEPAIEDAVTTLETLVDRSLVSTRSGSASTDRFALLEPMRVYGREMLVDAGEGPDVASGHAAIYCDMARKAEPEFYGRARRAWLERIAADHDNLRATFDELRDSGNLAAALALAADLWRFWQLRGHLVEGRERLDALLEEAATPGAPPVSPLILSRAEEAAGSIRYWMASGRDEPRAFYERSVAHAIESGDPLRIAWAKYNLAFAFDFTPAPEMGEANVQHATALREDALAKFRAAGDRRGVAESLWAMGANALIMLNEPAKSRQLLLEALALLEELGDVYTSGWALNSLALLSSAEGDLDAAEKRLLEAAAYFEHDLKGEPGEIVGLLALGSVAARRGDDVTAVRIAAAGEAAARELGAEIPRIGPIMDALAAAAANLAPDVLARERAVGVAMGARSMLSTMLGSASAATDAVRLGRGPLE